MRSPRLFLPVFMGCMLVPKVANGKPPLALLSCIGFAVLFPKATHAKKSIYYVYRAPPTSSPTSTPSYQPTARPSSQPTTSLQPTGSPSNSPSSHPSAGPSTTPSFHPSAAPSAQPSSHPTSKPSSSPSSQPTFEPSAHPSSYPTLSQKPSPQPTLNPSISPTYSMQPSSSQQISSSFLATKSMKSFMTSPLMISLIGSVLCLVGVGLFLVARKSKKSPPTYDESDDESSQDSFDDKYKVNFDGFDDFEISSQSSSNTEEESATAAGAKNWGQTFTGLGWRTKSVPESGSVGSREESTVSGGNGNSVADTLSQTLSGLSEVAEDAIFPVSNKRGRSKRHGNRGDRKKSGDQYDSCKRQYHYRSGDDESIPIAESASSEFGASSRGNISVASGASSQADSSASEEVETVWSDHHSQGSSV